MLNVIKKIIGRISHDKANLSDVIYIGPNNVNYQLIDEKRFRKKINGVNVLGGNWDLNIKERYGEKDIGYFSMKEHFLEGKDWLETKIFLEHYPVKLKQKGEIRGCKKLEDLAYNYEMNIDPLYKNIKDKGFFQPYDKNNTEPIGVYIGRKGDIIYSGGGNHRLHISKVLGLVEIPVFVRLRHKLWVERKREIIHKISDNKNVDHNIKCHPDIKNCAIKNIK